MKLDVSIAATELSNQIGATLEDDPVSGTFKGGNGAEVSGDKALGCAAEFSASLKRAKAWVSEPKRGYRRGYRSTFLFQESSIHAGCEPSFKRFHTTISSDRGL
jgi:hypothetical protein